MRLLEYVAIGCSFVVFVTQVLIPVLLQQPLFPILRKSPVDERIKEARLRIEEQQKAVELRALEERESQLRVKTGFVQSVEEDDADSAEPASEENN